MIVESNNKGSRQKKYITQTINYLFFWTTSLGISDKSKAQYYETLG